MKRLWRLPAAISAGAWALLATAPAFGLDEIPWDVYEYALRWGGPEDLDSGGGSCLGVLGIISLALWIWMLVDLLGRQEHEFPNSRGTSKVTWLVIMFASWIVALPLIAAVAYYFMVFKQVKRSTVQRAGAAGAAGDAASRQQAPDAPAVASVPAAWHPDPIGRHELRYWDGSRWSQHVSDAGVQSTDPLQTP